MIDQTASLDVEALRTAEYPWMANDPGVYLNAASEERL